jgi:hypothetical protein
MIENHWIYVPNKECIVRTDSMYVAGFKNINHKGTYKEGRLYSLENGTKHARITRKTIRSWRST